MTEEIDYRAVCGQLQLENEALRSNIQQIMGRVEWSMPDFGLARFRKLSFHERYYVIAAACMIALVAIAAYCAMRGD